MSKDTDAVPPDRKGPNYEVRVRILTALLPQLAAAAVVGQKVTGLPLPELVLLVLMLGAELRVPFEMPPPVVLSPGEEGAPTIWVLAEPRKDFGVLLRSIYACADAQAVAVFDNPPPPGFVYVVLGTPGGYMSAAFELVSPVHEPDHQNSN